MLWDDWPCKPGMFTLAVSLPSLLPSLWEIQYVSFWQRPQCVIFGGLKNWDREKLGSLKEAEANTEASSVLRLPPLTQIEVIYLNRRLPLPKEGLHTHSSVQLLSHVTLFVTP